MTVFLHFWPRTMGLFRLRAWNGIFFVCFIDSFCFAYNAQILRAERSIKETKNARSTLVVETSLNKNIKHTLVTNTRFQNLLVQNLVRATKHIIKHQCSNTKAEIILFLIYPFFIRLPLQKIIHPVRNTVLQVSTAAGESTQCQE